MSLVLKVRVDFRNSPFSQRPQGTYLPPKFWITIVSNFPWVVSRPQRNRRQRYAFFSGGGGKKFYHIVLLFFRTIVRAASPPTTCSRFHKSLEIHERTDAKNGLLQWYGHPSVLGISISKTRVIQASPSHITLASWVRGRVTGEGFESGDAHITMTAPLKRSRTAVRRNSDPVPHTTVK